MTVPEHRIAMAESDNTSTLDEMFERLETMPVPEGYKVEIVEGTVYMSPQRDTHWEIIADIYEQLRTKYPRKRLKSDVRIDYPGHLNGFATDVTVMAEGAAKAEGGQVETRVPFGKDMDLTHTVVGLPLRTDEFPRDWLTESAPWRSSITPPSSPASWNC